MSDARGSRVRLSGFFRPAAVLNMISSPSSTYHITVRWAEPFSLVVPSTAKRCSRRKSRSACVNARFNPHLSAFLTEQVTVRGSNVLLRRLSWFVEGEATDERHWTAIQLSHDQLCRPRDLVGDGDLGHAQLIALRVALTDVTFERGQARDPDGHIGVTLAPRAPERIGDDDADGRPRDSAECLAQPRRRRVGIHR